MRIETNEQRRRYKNDFQRLFTEYTQLHDFLERTSQDFQEQHYRLKQQGYGTPQYEVS